MIGRLRKITEAAAANYPFMEMNANCPGWGVHKASLSRDTRPRQ